MKHLNNVPYLVIGVLIGRRYAITIFFCSTSFNFLSSLHKQSSLFLDLDLGESPDAYLCHYQGRSLGEGVRGIVSSSSKEVR